MIRVSRMVFVFRSFVLFVRVQISGHKSLGAYPMYLFCPVGRYYSYNSPPDFLLFHEKSGKEVNEEVFPKSGNLT